MGYSFSEIVCRENGHFGLQMSQVNEGTALDPNFATARRILKFPFLYRVFYNSEKVSSEESLYSTEYTSLNVLRNYAADDECYFRDVERSLQHFLPPLFPCSER